MCLKNMSKIISILILCAAVLLGFAQGQTQSQTGSPPGILEITFPATIQANGEEYKGRILFKDADGDAERGDLRIIKAEDPQSIIINGQTPEDNLVSLEIKSPPEKQKEGQGIILLKISTTTPQEVKIQVILVDKAGNESEPEEFSFRARGNIPDLVISLETLPSEVYVDQEIEVGYTIRNIGGGDAGPFRIGVYLSSDGNVTREDLLLGSQEISGLASDVSVSQAVKVKLTQELLSRGGLQPGPLFLGVIADDLNQVKESDETNNVASAAIRVELPPKRPAFFKVVDLSIEPSSPVAGSTVTIKATIENTGEEPGTKPVELYIDGVRRDSRSLTLNPGQRKTVSFSHTFAFTEPPLRVEITVKTPDDEQTLIVTVSQPPILQVSPTSLRFQGEEGGTNPEPQAITITNAGGGFLNWTATSDANWLMLGADRGSLAAGLSSEVKVFVNIAGLPSGTHQSRITVTAPEAQGSPAFVQVSLALKPRLQAQYTVCPSGCRYNLISQAIAAARSGDTITIGPGTYYENIEIAKGLTLRGAGKEKTIIKSAQLGYPVIRIESDSQIEVAIEDLTAAEAKARTQPTYEPTYDEDGIHVEGKARVRIQNVQASGNTFGGLDVGGSAQVTVSNSLFFDNLTGIKLWNSAQVTISDSQISDNWEGIDMCCDEPQATISRSQISGNRSNGIEMKNSSQATIQNNTIQDNGGYGVELYLPACEKDYDRDFEFKGKVRGSGNQISGNKLGNLCPPPRQYPWPSGFGGGA